MKPSRFTDDLTDDLTEKQLHILVGWLGRNRYTCTRERIMECREYMALPAAPEPKVVQGVKMTPSPIPLFAASGTLGSHTYIRENDGKVHRYGMSGEHIALQLTKANTAGWMYEYLNEAFPRYAVVLK